MSKTYQFKVSTTMRDKKEGSFTICFENAPSEAEALQVALFDLKALDVSLSDVFRLEFIPLTYETKHLLWLLEKGIYIFNSNYKVSQENYITTYQDCDTYAGRWNKYE